MKLTPEASNFIAVTHGAVMEVSQSQSHCKDSKKELSHEVLEHKAKTVAGDYVGGNLYP